MKKFGEAIRLFLKIYFEPLPLFPSLSAFLSLFKESTAPRIASDCGSTPGRFSKTLCKNAGSVMTSLKSSSTSIAVSSFFGRLACCEIGSSTRANCIKKHVSYCRSSNLRASAIDICIANAICSSSVMLEKSGIISSVCNDLQGKVYDRKQVFLQQTILIIDKTKKT